ncbi:histone-like nucleoid-structuring protein Lsr2 [Nakamurella endophytica]|uniref:Lsr2 family protein n=1 Tax=Nakamurella endophytica TaxID=1748367 RepID=A0A917T6R1_9ACTN|nr:Lsr2 family protein [Nakamurella endophytica]GGM10229.1 hypothetical protein GCM10011594_32670 [Nakamurella endophytica]
MSSSDGLPARPTADRLRTNRFGHRRPTGESVWIAHHPTRSPCTGAHPAASQVTTTTTDDIDGSKAAETIRFALDGTDFEIDLSSRNAKALRKAMAEFVDHARRLPATSRPRSAAARNRAAAVRTDKAELVAIRTWAADNGHQLAARGRIPAHIRDQYLAAHAAD